MMVNNKIKSATEFLEMCSKLSKKTNVNADVVYSLLENYKIKDSDLEKNEVIHPLHYYENWYSALGNKENIDVYDWHERYPEHYSEYWSGFDNTKSMFSKNFIKIYLSLDADHICEGVKQLFSYLEQENISHTSKATSRVRTDNVIVRIGSRDFESLKKIYKFIDNNQYIQEGANQVNPFLPTIGKIGVMYDDGRSYNYDLSKLIANYVNTFDLKSGIDFSHFSKFILNEKQNDELFLQTFNQVFFEKNQYEQYVEGNVKDQSKIESNGSENNNRINIDIKMPSDILDFAILLAFEKYGKEQAISAIKNALNGNYDLFSRVGYDINGREVKVRESLKGNVSPEQIKYYVIQNNLFSQTESIDDAIINYVDSVIYKHKGKFLEDALYATAIKYFDTKSVVEKRINDYASLGSPSLFSRFNEKVRPDYNFREGVLQNVAPSKVYSVVESILTNHEINYNNKSLVDKVSDCSNIIMSKVSTKRI